VSMAPIFEDRCSADCHVSGDEQDLVESVKMTESTIYIQSRLTASEPSPCPAGYFVERRRAWGLGERVLLNSFSAVPLRSMHDRVGWTEGEYQLLMLTRSLEPSASL
jgi:hypothetical protein